MSRCTLDNALRFQKYLGNQTTCLTCAIQQSLNVIDPHPHKSYLCLNCGELITFDCQVSSLPPCPACGATDYEELPS